jgi:hypothetical protein
LALNCYPAIITVLVLGNFCQSPASIHPSQLSSSQLGIMLQDWSFQSPCLMYILSLIVAAAAVTAAGAADPAAAAAATGVPATGVINAYTAGSAAAAVNIKGGCCRLNMSA